MPYKLILLTFNYFISYTYVRYILVYPTFISLQKMLEISKSVGRQIRRIY